jgi:sulfonate transport system permease protein
MGIAQTVNSSIRDTYRGLVSFLALLGIWQAASTLDLFKNGLFPAPLEVYRTLAELTLEGTLGRELLRSCLREAAGFALGVGGGFLLGTAMGLSRTVEKLIGPLYHAMRQVPLLGWIPLIILWFGIADTSKIVFISIGAFYPMVLNTFEGIRSVPHNYVEVARVFEYGRLGLLRRFILPAALPGIMTGVRMSLGFSWMLVVGAEIFTRTDGGIGDLMWSGREQFRMDIVIVGVITVGLTGFLINEAVRLLERRLLRWRNTYH